MFPIKGLSKNHRVKVEGGVLCHAAAIEVTKNIAYSSTFAIKQSQIQYQNHFQVIQILLFLYIRKVQKGRTISNHQSYVRMIPLRLVYCNLPKGRFFNLIVEKIWLQKFADYSPIGYVMFPNEKA